MSDDVDNYNPVCLHKGGQTYESRVGTVCPFCGFIRHRHSVMRMVELGEFGGIRLLTSVPVPVREARRP